MSSAVILGMIVTMFPEPAEQARAIGVFSFVASAGASIGLLAGGVITQVMSWHWIFFVNLPIGVITAALAARLVPGDQGVGARGGADVPGAALSTGALMLAVYTIVKTDGYGWTSAHTLGLGGLALALLAAFVVWEARTEKPLLPLRILRSRDVSGANLVQMLFVAGMFGMFFMGSLYMQRVLGYSALEIGLAFLPVALLIGAFSLGLSARLTMRFGPRAILLVGLVMAAGGLGLFTQVPVHASYAGNLLPSLVLVGVGAGLSFPALMILAMSAAEPSDAGVASGLVNTTQQVGGALGLAVLATLSSAHTTSALHEHTSLAYALTSGYRLAWTLGTGLLIGAIVAAAALLRAPAPASRPADTRAADLPVKAGGSQAAPGLAGARPAYCEAS
jgi:MFS family permease